MITVSLGGHASRAGYNNDVCVKGVPWIREWAEAEDVLQAINSKKSNWSGGIRSSTPSGTNVEVVLLARNSISLVTKRD